MPGPTTVTFGNTTLSQGFDFTFGPGIYPSVCYFRTVPHVPTLPQVADLTFSTEGGAELSFAECCLEEPRLDANQSGQRWTLPIKDRRWKWQPPWGPIYGHYNVPKPDGTYKYEKTPQQLATLLLEAMGETGFDVSKLPNETRPEIHWDGAHAASELEILCNSLSCVVVLNPFRNRVELWPIGQGGVFPSGQTIGSAYTPVLPVKPQSIRVEAGPTLFQALFKTEAVGLDTDEKWKPIDELSYKPAKGWGRTTSYGFQEITGTYTVHGRTLQKRDLALATVRRCYRISGLSHGGWVPNAAWEAGQAPNSRKDFQFFDYLADQEISPADGGLRNLPARILARWISPGVGGQEQRLYTDGYTFDTTQGIITFAEPIFQVGPAPAYDIQPADVRIECAFHAGNNGYLHRRYINRNLNPGWATKQRLVQRSDIKYRTLMRYTDDANFSVEDTEADTSAKLGFWADAAEAEYVLQQGGTVRYAGLVPCSPDGAIVQVSWSGGGLSAPTTIVSKAQRHNRLVNDPNTLRSRVVAQTLEQAEKAATGKLDSDQRMIRWASGVV